MLIHAFSLVNARLLMAFGTAFYAITHVITLWPLDVASLTTSVSSMRFLPEIMLILWAIKSHLKGQMINRILHWWSFHKKFMKLAEGSFHKFHMK